MGWNNYVWNLYKNSESGAKVIKEWKEAQTWSATLDILTEQVQKENIDKERKFSQIVYDYFREKDFSPDDAELFFTNWIKEGIPVPIEGQDFISANKPEYWCAQFAEDDFLSFILYSVAPDFFVCWRFLVDDPDFNFSTFQQICHEFGIPLPNVPLKKEKLKRALYYIKICYALLEFRKCNFLLPEELCAFLYDFAPEYLEIDKQQREALPEPYKVWYIVENSIDNKWVDSLSSDTPPMRWQLNENMRTGDILVLYCAKPHSSLHSVWRVIQPPVANPFFYYYYEGYIGQSIVTKEITLSEARKNPVLSKNSKVLCNFWSANGSPVSYEEYTEMLKLWEEKGMDISILPVIKPIVGLDEAIKLVNEKDVETYLIEPFLKRLGYTEDDWIRQMPIKMGRGFCYYPDYCLNANLKFGEERVEWLVEAKYRIVHSKQLEKDFYQAKSYALRLVSKFFMLASQEGVWIFLKHKDDFSLENKICYNWNELSEPDIFHRILQLIGKNNIKNTNNRTKQKRSI